MKEAYLSISTSATAETTAKGSRFIARAQPVSQHEDAMDWVGEISKRFHDATHNCYAYKIGSGDSSVFRYSDDGEPSGSAGRPIYQAIEGRGLTNVVLVVTRYFGGTKLGVGGLIRAYGGAAAGCLQNAKIVKYDPKLVLEVHLSYEFTGIIHQLVERFRAEVIESDFTARPTYHVRLKSADETRFRQLLNDHTKGQVQVKTSAADGSV